MATGIANDQDHTDNDYQLRIANLLLKIAPSAVRVYFDRQFKPESLQLVLNQNRFKTLQHLKTKKVITQKQWELLFPTKGVSSSCSFDLTLMVCLLRNLGKMKIEDGLPTKHVEYTDEDALSTIKYYRNIIAHSDSHCLLTEVEFNDQWKSLSEAIIQLGGEHYKKVCIDLHSYKLDKEVLLEVRNLYSTVSSIPRGLQDIYLETIQEWRLTNNKVVQTKVIQALKDMIKTSHLFIVIGPPGCGKSTAVHHIALQLQDTENYDIIPAKFPQYITQFYDPETKQVFVFDDFCGKYTIEIQTVNAWGKLCNDIISAISKDTIKILFTCRAYIFNNKKVKNLQIPWIQLDLLSPKYILSNEEKDLIANMYLSEEQVGELKQHQDLDGYECFPLLCQLCSSKGTCDVVKFFASPVDVIKTDLISIMESDDQTALAVLALFVVFNNSLTEDKLTARNQELRDLLQQLSQIFITRYSLSVQVVKDHLYSLTNTYVTKTCNKFTLLHNKLYDIISSFFGDHMFEFTVEYSHPEFIRDRFQFDSINEIKEACIISVREDKEVEYFKRLFKDLENGYFDEVFANRQFQCNFFRTKFIQNMKHQIKTTNCLLCRSGTSPLFEVARKGQSDVAEMLIETGVDPDICDKNGRTAVYFAAQMGHVETVKMLVAKKCDLNISRNDYWHKDESPLYVAAANGHLNVLKLLYRNKQDCYRAIKEAFYCGKTPLHGAIESNYVEIVKFFMDNDCDPNIINEDHESPLWLAAGNGNHEIVEILLQHGSKPNLHTKKNGPPLITASWNGHTEVVRRLLKYEADPNLTNANGCSPLFYAAHEGAVNIVRLLLQSNANINAQTNSKMTPLFIAAIKGRTEVVELLLSKGALVNTCNDNRESPLFVASKQGFFDIVKLLLYNRPKIYIENLDGETALSVAEKLGFNDIETAISSHILSNKCNIGRRNDFGWNSRRSNACCAIS